MTTATTEAQPVATEQDNPQLVQTIIAKRGERFELYGVYDRPSKGVVGEPYSKVLKHTGTLPECLIQQSNLLIEQWDFDRESIVDDCPHCYKRPVITGYCHECYRSENWDPGYF